jgi:hypothetical protein
MPKLFLHIVETCWAVSMGFTPRMKTNHEADFARYGVRFSIVHRMIHSMHSLYIVINYTVWKPVERKLVYEFHPEPVLSSPTRRQYFA